MEGTSGWQVWAFSGVQGKTEMQQGLDQTLKQTTRSPFFDSATCVSPGECRFQIFFSVCFWVWERDQGLTGLCSVCRGTKEPAHCMWVPRGFAFVSARFHIQLGNANRQLQYLYCLVQFLFFFFECVFLFNSCFSSSTWINIALGKSYVD